MAYLFRDFIFSLTDSLAVSYCNSLCRSHAQHICRISHGLGDFRISSRRLSSRPHHAPHERLIFVRHNFAGLIHNRSRSDRTSRLHVNGVAGNTDKSTCRSSLHIDICYHRLFIPQDSRPDAVCSINSSSVGIQIQKNIVCIRLSGLFQSQSHKPLG